MGLGDSRSGRKRDERTRVEGRTEGNEGPRARASKDMCHGKKEERRKLYPTLYRRGALYLTRRPKLIYCLLRNMAVTSLLRINSLFLYFHLEPFRRLPSGRTGERKERDEKLEKTVVTVIFTIRRAD